MSETYGRLSNEMTDMAVKYCLKDLVDLGEPQTQTDRKSKRVHQGVTLRMISQALLTTGYISHLYTYTSAALLHYNMVKQTSQVKKSFFPNLKKNERMVA